MRGKNSLGAIRRGRSAIGLLLLRCRIRAGKGRAAVRAVVHADESAEIPEIGRRAAQLGAQRWTLIVLVESRFAGKISVAYPAVQPRDRVFLLLLRHVCFERIRA